MYEIENIILIACHCFSHIFHLHGFNFWAEPFTKVCESESAKIYKRKRHMGKCSDRVFPRHIEEPPKEDYS